MWATEPLAQLPVVAVVLLAMYATAKWCDRRHERELDRERAGSDEQLRQVERKHKAIVRAKNDLIRELRRRVRRGSGR
jgi:choline-glycine betaine transporter